MISLQTNADSINAQNNLSINNSFESQTIQQLTSGYRINKSGDDAAGLAIANAYRDNIAEVTQGVQNANNAVSQLQIVDGGLSNISTILDRLKTLATESASSGFTGNRSTLNQEYQNLLGEITRQASNINLNAGGTFNANLNIYIGGANTASNANVNIDLSGAANGVDATSLGLNNTDVLGSGVLLTGNTTRLDAPGATFLAGGSQGFTFNLIQNGVATQITATANAGAAAGGETRAQVLSDLNSTLNTYGITASVNSGNGQLQFSGATAFSVTDNGATGGNAISSATATTDNAALYTFDTSASSWVTPTAGKNETVTFTSGAGTKTVTLTSTSDTSTSAAIADINSQTASLGIYAVNSNGKISFQSSNNFSLTDAVATGGATDIFGTTAGSSVTHTATAPTTTDTTNANSAISAIDAAIQTLGTVQGRVGAGENTLQYAISLAQSQISNFSSAQSAIRDADVAKQAANLTKSQVLVQTSVAALAQANAEPQAVLKLLQG